MAGTAAPNDRHSVHPISSEITKEISSKSAASPSPAKAGSAARNSEPLTDERLHEIVRTLRGVGWTENEILQKHAKLGMTAAHIEGSRQ